MCLAASSYPRISDTHVELTAEREAHIRARHTPLVRLGLDAQVADALADPDLVGRRLVDPFERGILSRGRLGVGGRRRPVRPGRQECYDEALGRYRVHGSKFRRMGD